MVRHIISNASALHSLKVSCRCLTEKETVGYCVLTWELLIQYLFILSENIVLKKLFSDFVVKGCTKFFLLSHYMM